MKLFSKHHTLIAFAILTSAVSFAQKEAATAKHEFTVQQAIAYAQKNNSAVKNALIGIKLQEETNQQITASAFPHLNASLSTTMNPNIAMASVEPQMN